jgi:hypothetical protein
VHDDPGPGYGRGQALAGGQVAGHELRAAMTLPAQHPDLAARIPQPGHDLAAERAGPAGDQDERRRHRFLLRPGS